VKSRVAEVNNFFDSDALKSDLKRETSSAKNADIEKRRQEIEKSIQERYEKSDRPNGLKRILDTHGVDDPLVDELNRMATSSVSRDAMIQHVGSHFPEKSKSDWNDILVASLGVRGRKPKGMSTDHARHHEHQFRKQQYERKRATFEAVRADTLESKSAAAAAGNRGDL
jgi:hypothetical protein